MTNIEAQAVQAVQTVYNCTQVCKADNNLEGAIQWANEGLGMMKMFNLITGKTIRVVDGKAVIVEEV